VRRFVAELRRRSVIKIALLYAAFAVAIIAFSSDIESALGLPDFTDTLIVVLSALGFPIAVVFAWVFDLTPHGLEVTKSVEDASAKTLVPPGPDTELASVAVLPFKGRGDTFFAEAIPLELHSTLSRVNRLRIVSEQSSIAYSEAGMDLRSVASRLGVNYVISGSVIRHENTVRIVAELYDAMSDTLLWSKQFDANLNNVFESERQIAEAVAVAFGGERLRLEVEHARAGQPSDQAAWELVQRARGYLIRYTMDSVAEAIPLLKRAVDLDPGYAVGYANLGLVTAEKTLNAIGEDPDADRLAAQEASARAESLAPNDSVVLRSAGAVNAYCGNNVLSLSLLRRAVSLSPYDLGAWGYFGWPLASMGGPDNLAELHEILDRLLATGGQHPGIPYWLFHKSAAYCCEGEWEQSLDYIRRSMEVQPRFAFGAMHSANLLGQLGRYDEARSAVSRCTEMNPGMTTRYYAELISVLSGTDDIVAMRTAGLRKADLLSDV
jgi:TolB-like protein